MSVSARTDPVPGAPARPEAGRPSVPFPIRLGIGLDRSIWPVDRATAELRWAALTTAVMLAITLPAFLMTGPAGRYGTAVGVAAISFAIMGVVAWAPASVLVAQRTFVRRGIGPFIVLVALAAAGPYDTFTLEAPVGRPLIILALTFAALTPGFSIAAGALAVAAIGLLIGHVAVAGHPPLDEHSVAFLVATSVTFLTAGAIHYVDRGLRRERTRAEGLAARKVAQVDQLEGLQRIVRRFDGSRPVAAVMQDVVDDVATTFDIPLVSAYLPDDAGRLSIVGVAGYDRPFHVIQTGVGIIGRVAATRKVIFVPDVLTDPDYRAARDDVRSEVAVPVLHGDDLLGIVNFEGTALKPIGPAHIAVAEMLAGSIAAALRSARLDDERRERLHAIERVLEVSRGLAADLDRPRVVASVADAARDLLDAEAVEFASRGTDAAYRVEQVVGAGRHPIGSIVAAGDGLGGEVLATGDRVVIEGGAGLGLPIRLQGELSAVLTASRGATGRPFSELDLRIADLLVTQIQVALQNAELHARVAEAAVRDQLTGLLNRRYFDEAVETAFANATRTGAELSLVVLDLDRFSEVNNVHGHAVGDTVLRRVARAMAGAVRTGDIVARYGGEEFVVIAPASGTEGAVALAERIRAAVWLDSQRPFDGLSIPLTISAGVASRLGDEPDGRALFRAADSALLAAKRAGRDRVISL